MVVVYRPASLKELWKGGVENGGGEKGFLERKGVEKREERANIERKMEMKEGKKDCPPPPSLPVWHY